MALNIFTTQLQAMLPQWMKMAKDPTSVGAQFLDVFGIEFQAVKDFLDQASNNQFVGTADIGQIDITYKVPLVAPNLINMSTTHVISGTKDGISYEIKLFDTLSEFYSAPSEDHSSILDSDEGILYIRPSTDLIDANKTAPYDYMIIDGATHYDMILHHIWNAFDEFALLLGLQRLYGERNTQFKDRILDVFTNPGNSTKDGLLNAISRELGIDKTTITVNELTDTAFKNSLLNIDGTPTKKLVGYAEKINKVLGFSWDNMAWDEAYWRSIEEANVGFDYLPHVWDASMDLWTTEEFQSGVGDGDDLFVTAPVQQDDIRTFDYYVGLRGVKKSGQLIYPEHSFKYKITATGTILNQESKPQDYKYTIISSEIIDLYFVLRAFQQYMHNDVLDFSNTTAWQFDSGNNLEVVNGSTVMNPKADTIVEVQALLKTTSKVATPTLDSLTISWKDTIAGMHNFVLDTNFDRNDTAVSVTKQNVITPGVAEVASLDITVAPTSDGNVTTTLDGVATDTAIIGGTAEVSSLDVTAIPTIAGNITITLDGLATTVAVDPATDTTTDLVATKIRSATYAGWTTGGTASNVTFTATTVGVKTDASFSDTDATGVTATVSTTVQGVNADTTIDVATKIRNTSFTGWTTGGISSNVTFTATTTGSRVDATFSAGTTGATGTIATTIQGIDADHVELGYGDFDHVIDTQGDWEKGTLMNTQVLSEGTIRLVTPII